MPISFGTALTPPGDIVIYVNSINYTENAISWNFILADNEQSGFSITFLGISTSDKDNIKEQKEIRFELQSKLLFKGIIENAEYKTGEEAVAKGVGSGESYSKKMLADSTTSSLSGVEANRPVYENVLVKTIIIEQVSGVSNVIVDSIDDGSDLGSGTFRGDNINKMEFLSNIIIGSGGKWWFTYGNQTPYSDNILHASLYRGSASSVKTYNVDGANQNAELSENMKDFEGLGNIITVLGYGDGNNQIRSKTFHATINRSFLRSDLTVSGTIVELEDASLFIVYTDGFEDGDYTNDPTWIVGDGAWSVQTVPKNGIYSLRLTSAEGVGFYITPASDAGDWSCWMRNEDVTKNQSIQFKTAGGALSILHFRFDGTTSSIQYWNGSYVNFYNTPANSTWYKVRFVYTAGSAVGSVYIYNSSEALLASAIGISITNAGTIGRVELGSTDTQTKYWDDIVYGTTNFWVGMEKCSYSQKLGNVLSGVARQIPGSYVGPFITGGSTYYTVSGVSGYPHSKGIEVYDAQYTIDSVQSGTSISTFGKKEKSFQDKTVEDQNILDRTAQEYLAGLKDLVIRLKVLPADPHDAFTDVQVDDTITVIDSESDIDGEFKISRKTASSDAGYESCELECSNSRLKLVTELGEAEQAAVAQSKFMQGATNIFTVNETENTESGSAGAIDLFFEAPSDAVAINSVKLAYRNEAPRVWNDTAASAGASLISNDNANGGSTNCISASWTTVLDVNTDTVNSAGMWTYMQAYSSVLTPPLSGRIYNVTDNEYYPTSTVNYDFFTLTGVQYAPLYILVPKNLNGKRWQYQLYNNSGANETINWRLNRYYIGNHTHDNTYDIVSKTYTTTDVSIYTSDDASGSPSWTDRTATIEAIYGTLAATENASETGLELKSFFTGTGWKGIRLQTNGNSRHKANVTIKCFVESR